MNTTVKESNKGIESAQNARMRWLFEKSIGGLFWCIGRYCGCVTKPSSSLRKNRQDGLILYVCMTVDPTIGICSRAVEKVSR